MGNVRYVFITARMCSVVSPGTWLLHQAFYWIYSAYAPSMHGLVNICWRTWILWYSLQRIAWVFHIDIHLHVSSHVFHIAYLFTRQCKKKRIRLIVNNYKTEGLGTRLYQSNLFNMICIVRRFYPLWLICARDYDVWIPFLDHARNGRLNLFSTYEWLGRYLSSFVIWSTCGSP